MIIRNLRSYQDMEDAPERTLSRNEYLEALSDISHAAEDSLANLSTAIDEFMAKVASVNAQVSEEAIDAAKEADARAEALFEFVETRLIPALSPTLS